MNILTKTFTKKSAEVKFYKSAKYYSYVKSNYIDEKKLFIQEEESGDTYKITLTAINSFNLDDFLNDLTVKEFFLERNSYNLKNSITETVE